ncbi:MAG: hypothetical protein Q8O75_01765 [bacterium]|nr:hypothetical protein [bacterium]
MDKKTLSSGLIVLSIIAAIFAALDFLVNFPTLGLGADSWVGVAAVAGVWAVYTKTA